MTDTTTPHVLPTRDGNGYRIHWERRTHGIEGTYQVGCRCEQCRDAHRVYTAIRRGAMAPEIVAQRIRQIDAALRRHREAVNTLTSEREALEQRQRDGED